MATVMLAWTVEQIIERVKELGKPPIEFDAPGDDPWVADVKEFGLAWYAAAEGGDVYWRISGALQVTDAATLPVVEVDPGEVAYSNQTDGVRLDVLAWYLTHEQSDLYDPDGWYGTDWPVLIPVPEGGYLLADGNHRTVAAKLLDRPLLAHVIEVL